MGSWGTGLFQNDIAEDVKTVYVNKLKIGKSDEEALQEIIAENSNLIQDTDDSIDFWLGLASIMYDFGRLSEEVKAKALEIIANNEDINRWNIRERNKRLAVLEKLKEKLNSPIPPRKKILQTKKFVSEWKKNDIYFIRAKDLCDTIKEGYFVFCTLTTVNFDARVKNLGDILPITYLKYVPNLPKNIQEIDDVPFLLHHNVCDKYYYLFLWMTDGFHKVKSKFVYGGNYEFKKNMPELELSDDYKLGIIDFLKNVSRFL